MNINNNKFLANILIMTDMGRYICIGSQGNPEGKQFSWKFNSGDDFFGFKLCAQEYICYLAPMKISNLPHPVIEPIIKTLNPMDPIKPGFNDYNIN